MPDFMLENAVHLDQSRKITCFAKTEKSAFANVAV